MSFMGKAGLAVAMLGLAAGSVFGAGAAKADNLYAAYAVSNQEWVFGVGVNAPSREDAEAEAIANCGADDCRIVTWWGNGCGALVESDQGFAVAVGPTRADAEREAYTTLSEITPTAQLANVGSSQFSGTDLIDVTCTANAV
ncbi:DUF4189 domain-containing protein [Nocardia rhizosphaerae]|uniref:DUF4189 domain-containing protein n=1 Tax=Nocardia rhizosphaerae TaxID=1691571 RepID=A0ABV8L9M4_9NOCA